KPPTELPQESSCGPRAKGWSPNGGADSYEHSPKSTHGDARPMLLNTLFERLRNQRWGNARALCLCVESEPHKLQQPNLVGMVLAGPFESCLRDGVSLVWMVQKIADFLDQIGIVLK